MQTALQGLPLVAHGGQLYRIGGMQAANPPGETEELSSVDEVARFDPSTMTWTTLPRLPAGRSSHDAVVVGDKIYVVGGWQLTSEGSEWHETALVLDLTAKPLEWSEFDAPFQRRALAAGTRDGKVYVLCGMDDFNDIDRSVDVFDPAAGKWSQGPDLPGEAMEGFGVSAWQIANQMFISGAGGVLYRLNAAGDGWDEVCKLTEGRFFHRLLPLDGEQLLAVGGASQRGHLTNIERLEAILPAAAGL
jgi:hypothetical protein